LAEAGAPKPFWSGTISFGLVTIPVALYAATRTSSGRSLRQLAPDGALLRREYVCPTHGRPLERDEIVRAYELEDGELVVVTDEELEALAPEASRDIELKQFVDRAELSPLLFDRSYFLLPSSDSTKPYRLLTQVLEEQQRAGIATFVMRGHQHVVAIIAEDQLLRAQTLRFASELRTPETIGLPEPPAQIDAARVERLRAMIREHSEADIDRAELDDDTRERVIALADRKLAEGRDLVEPPSDEGGAEVSGDAEVIDLIDVLARSLARPG
jgi:DNA end-binding protein Ku